MPTHEPTPGDQPADQFTPAVDASLIDKSVERDKDKYMTADEIVERITEAPPGTDLAPVYENYRRYLVDESKPPIERMLVVSELMSKMPAKLAKQRKSLTSPSYNSSQSTMNYAEQKDYFDKRRRGLYENSMEKDLIAFVKSFGEQYKKENPDSFS